MLLKYNIIIRVEWARKQETNLCNITVFHENETIVLTQQSADTYTNTAARLRTGRHSYDDILSVQLHVYRNITKDQLFTQTKTIPER